MDEQVRVEFDPPHQCRETEKAWCMAVGGGETVLLPKSQAELQWEGAEVKAVILPRWLAEKRGLVAADCLQETDSHQEQQTTDSMSRDDWLRLGLTMALLIRGEDNNDAVREARHLARRLQGDS